MQHLAVTRQASLSLLLCFSLTGCSLLSDGPSRKVGYTVNWAVQKDFYTRLMSLPGIDTGSVYCDRHMVILFDPDCPACTEQWQILQPYITRARIHWVPMGTNKTSIRRGAALLAAINPPAALFYNFVRFDTNTKQGGYPISQAPPQWATEAVQANNRSSVVHEYIWGTPTLGFELENGKHCYGFSGVMNDNDIEQIIKNLGNIQTAPLNGFMSIKRRQYLCVRGSSERR